jgi:hypothetical protein
MPSKSPAQARLFAAVAHNPAFAKKVGIPQNVGRDFNQADAGTGILSGPRNNSPLRKIGHLSGYGVRGRGYGSR